MDGTRIVVVSNGALAPRHFDQASTTRLAGKEGALGLGIVRGLMRGARNRKDAGEISRLSLHLTKQEARNAVARLTLAAQR